MPPKKKKTTTKKPATKKTTITKEQVIKAYKECADRTIECEKSIQKLKDAIASLASQVADLQSSDNRTKAMISDTDIDFAALVQIVKLLCKRSATSAVRIPESLIARLP